MNPAQQILITAVRIYQVALSPMLTCLFRPLGLGCRFHPTCSHYALESLQRHGALKGTMLAMGRLCRCHPWGGCGEDPVPDQFRIRDLRSCLRSRAGISSGGRFVTLGDVEDIAKAPPEERRTPGQGSREAAQSR